MLTVALTCILLTLVVASLAAQPEKPSTRERGYTLDPRFNYVAKGMAALSFIPLEGGKLLNLSSEDGGKVRVSEDDGQSWTQIATMYEGEGPGKPTRDYECAHAAITPSGVIIWIYRDFEGWHWEWDNETGEAVNPTLPVWAIRSLDGGKTWVDRQKIFDGYCGSINDMLVTREGNVVVPMEIYMPKPGRHCTRSYITEDEGKTYRAGNIIDLGGHGHHDGAMEATLTELEDGRLLMLIRTPLDRLWKAYSFDGGRSFRQIEPTDVPASNAPGALTRLASGRLVLVWNRMSPGRQMRPLLELRPKGPRQGWGTELPSDGWRNALSIAVSEDAGETWSEPVDFARGPRVCYPQVWERRPGEVWISFVAGKAWTRNLLSVKEEDLLRPLAEVEGDRLTIVAFGSSTTAPRGGLTVYATLLDWELQDEGRAVQVINAGKGSDTTTLARNRFDTDVLAYQPDLVIIQLGLNDSAIDVWRGVTEPRVPIDEYEQNLDFMVSQLKPRGAKVVLMTPNPLRWNDKLKDLYGKPPYNPDDPDGFNFLLRDYVDRVRQLATKHGVPLVDSFKVFRDYGEVEGQSVDDLLLDGMHPNNEGHSIEADLLMGHIRQMFPLAED